MQKKGAIKKKKKTLQRVHRMASIFSIKKAVRVSKIWVLDVDLNSNFFHVILFIFLRQCGGVYSLTHDIEGDFVLDLNLYVPSFAVIYPTWHFRVILKTFFPHKKVIRRNSSCIWWQSSLTGLQGPVNQSPLQTSSPVQFCSDSYLSSASHFASSTFLTPSSS